MFAGVLLFRALVMLFYFNQFCVSPPFFWRYRNWCALSYCMPNRSVLRTTVCFLCKQVLQGHLGCCKGLTPTEMRMVSEVPPHVQKAFQREVLPSAFHKRFSSLRVIVPFSPLHRSRPSHTSASSGPSVSVMGCAGGRTIGVGSKQNNDENINQPGTIYLHAFSDLSRISPVMFVYLLKECYMCGTLKATLKFRVLRQHVLHALHNSPQLGPACFVIQCLYIFPLLGPLYTEGFSHLLISSLHRLQTVDMVHIRTSDAKHLAAQLFLDILSCSVIHKERILLKLLEVFDIELTDIGKAIYGSDMDDVYLGMVKSKIGQYIVDYVESQSYITAVTLMKHFSIYPPCQSGQSFLEKLIHENQFRAAENWATLMGKQMICVLVQKYLDMKMLKQAYDIIKRNNLNQEFPDAYHLYKKSSLKKLAEKGCWDVAEIRAKNDQQLLEYLVYLAMEAGYSEKVDELCERYSLSGFIGATVPEACPLESRYMHVKEFALDDISWVDNIHGLHHATCYIQDCKVVGIDCEWKPNYVKGCKPNKVSIMQIASEKRVFIFDLIKLYEDERKGLDECFKSIFHSPKILKLGYNLQCDLHQLSHSYGDLECFRCYDMLLDIQKLFKEHRGGLSGLAKTILGAGLNKTRRNSNWEQRPLSQNQIEYAALDAAVLVHIFRHVHSQQHSADAEDKRSKSDWKSHIVSHLGNMRGCQSFADNQNDVEVGLEN